MHAFTQREISKALGVSQPTVSEWLSLADVPPTIPPQPGHTLVAFCISELTRHGMSGPEAASIISQCRGEVEWLLNEAGRTCWLSIYQNGGGEIVSLATSLSRERLDGHFESRPVGKVVALHVIVARACERIVLLQKAAANV